MNFEKILIMSSQFIHPVNLQFDIDWAKISATYDSLIKMIEQNKFQSYGAEAYKSKVYSLGYLGGCMIVSDTLTKPHAWWIWAGDYLEKFLGPEILNLKKEIINAGFDFVNFNYTKHQGSIARHIDGKSPGEAPDGHCNLNFIVSSTDPHACTIATDNKTTEQYQSVTGTCWLLNTAAYHQVNNTGHREVFQIKIHNAFLDVKSFFDQLDLTKFTKVAG